MSLLVPDSGLLFWMLLSFGIVFFVLAKYGFPVIVKMVNERKEYIDRSLVVAKEANEQLANLKAEGETIMAKAHEEQARILNEAAATRDRIIKEAKEQARIEGDKMMEEVKRQIQAEKEDAIRDIRRQVAVLSVDIAEKVLRKNLDDENKQTAMYIGVVSMRYAKALLAYADDAKVEDAIYREALLLKDSYAQVPELRQAMDNPVLAPDVKLRLVVEAAGGKVTKELERFVQLVLKEKREKFLQFMINSYIDLYRKQKNISIGKLTTAYPVAPEVVERIRKIVVSRTKGTAEFATRVDASLEGGFIFEIGTYRLDASVASQIRRVKQQFIEKNRRKI